MSEGTRQLLRIGVLLEAPLRLLGLRSLFEDLAEFIELWPTEAVRRHDLSMLIVDSNEHLFQQLATFRQARAGLRILVLGQSTDSVYISRVVAAGAKGYLSHSASIAEMQTAMRVVADGSIWAPRKVLSGLIDTLSLAEPTQRTVSFTPRERDLLQHLVDGHPDRVIAAEMGVSVRTVQGMVAGLLRRVGVTNRVALTVYVIEKHFIV